MTCRYDVCRACRDHVDYVPHEHLVFPMGSYEATEASGRSSAELVRHAFQLYAIFKREGIGS